MESNEKINCSEHLNMLFADEECMDELWLTQQKQGWYQIFCLIRLTKQMELNPIAFLN